MQKRILSHLYAITPTAFLWIYVGVWMICLLLGYFLTAGFYVFVTAIWALMGVVVIYQYRKPPIKPNNSVFLIPVFGLVYAGLLYSGLLFQPELISDKSQTTTTTGIVPETREHHRTSGKGARDFYSLVIHGSRFHCDDDDGYDACDKVYAYHGQTAKVLSHNGLAYEIEINGQKIYEFNAQLEKFKASQEKRKWQFIWAVILFGLPSVVFYFINRIVVRDLAVKQEEVSTSPSPQRRGMTIRSHTGELLLGEHRSPKTKTQEIRSRMMAGGHAWRILFAVLGTLSFMLFLLAWVMGEYLKLSLFLVLSVMMYYVASLPRQNAKKEVAFYHEMLETNQAGVGELSDYESSGFYNHMGIIVWAMMVVFVVLAFLLGSMLIWAVSDGLDRGFVIFLTMCTLLCLLVVGFMVKGAINQRDLAME